MKWQQDGQNNHYLLLNCLTVEVFLAGKEYEAKVEFNGKLMPLKGFTDLDAAKQAGVNYALQILLGDLEAIRSLNN